MSIKLFFCYSTKDSRYRAELADHLSPLRDNGTIADWYDQMIKPGKEWDQEIQQKLEEAQIILVLISANMLASRYIHNIELERALVRHEEKTVCVIPVILSDCDWASTPLGKLKALPQSGRAIVSWPNRPKAYLDVVVGIRQVIESLPQSASVHPNQTVLQGLITKKAGVVVLRAMNQSIAHDVLLTCLHTAFGSGAMVVRTDLVAFQKYQLTDAKTFFVSLVRDINQQLRITKSLSEMWDNELGNGANLTYFLRDTVLPKVTRNIIWVVNAVDLLLDCDFHNEFFVCLRSIFNLRAMDPAGGWDRLTILLICSNDPSSFINDPNMSPFNVGTWLVFD